MPKRSPLYSRARAQYHYLLSRGILKAEALKRVKRDFGVTLT